MDDAPLLDAPWPPDLNPATVPFHRRTVTILRRAGFFDDWTRFNTLTEAEVLGWWYAGVGIVADIRTTGNAAIVHYHGASQAGEPWAAHIWDRDPRFEEYLPKSGGTVYGIATSGTDDDRMLLWNNLEALKGAVEAQAALSLPDAVSSYVEAISGQHGERLDMLLAVTGLNGLDPISALEGSRRIGRAPTRAGQLRRRLMVLRDQARPPAGIWMPQVGEAERDGWPGEYTEVGVEATREFLGRTTDEHG